MKRLSKAQNQFALPLHQETPQPFDGKSNEELLNVLAELLREALSGETETNAEQEGKSLES